jgi:hypothetical protein
MDQKRNNERPENEFLSESWLVDFGRRHNTKDGSITAKNNVKLDPHGASRHSRIAS